MTRLVRVIPDTKLVRGYITTGQNLRDIDQNSFLAINGADGGTWAPSSHIVIDGAGVVVGAHWKMNGANVVASGPYTFGKNTSDDYWQLSVGHVATSATLITQFIEFINFNLVDITIDNLTFFSSSVISTGISLTVSGQLTRFVIPLNVYNGGTITDVIVTFNVGENHLPQYLPKFRILRMDSQGVVQSLRASDLIETDGDGFIPFNPTPSSAANWYNGGSLKTFTYSCNQNQLIDTSKYFYYLEIVEEGGNGSYAVVGNTWRSATATFTNISLIDGRT